MLATVGAGRSWWSRGAAGGAGVAVEGTGLHGGFIAQGLVIALGGRGAGRHPPSASAAALFAGFLLGRLLPWGGLALLRRPRCCSTSAGDSRACPASGVLAPARPGTLAIGFAVGAFLGAHLLVTASLTFGYGVSVASLAGYATALAYDAGANALSAEWLFRGALFSHWWRHWGFWGAAATATAMGLLRYLLDPALPQTAEARAGAIFYLAALGLAASVLRAWSGSLVPGYLASIAFFAAYRTLVVW